MTGNRPKKKKKAPQGRRYVHGGYSLVSRDEVMKDNPRIRRYLEDSRAGLVRDIAGDEASLTEGQRILIDRIISKLAVTRLIESFVEKHGPFEGKELRKMLGQNYLSFDNSIRLSLVALGLDKRASEKILDPIDYIQSFDERKKKSRKK